MGGGAGCGRGRGRGQESHLHPVRPSVTPGSGRVLSEKPAGTTASASSCPGLTTPGELRATEHPRPRPKPERRARARGPRRRRVEQTPRHDCTCTFATCAHACAHTHADTRLHRPWAPRSCPASGLPSSDSAPPVSLRKSPLCPSGPRNTEAPLGHCLCPVPPSATWLVRGGTCHPHPAMRDGLGCDLSCESAGWAG